MLGKPYSEQFTQHIDRLNWDIELPETLADFFDRSGPCAAGPSDRRSSARIRVRAMAILVPELSPPALPRPTAAMGVYTGDFSRKGISFLASQQFWPEEIVRLVLQTFWIRVRVVRQRYHGRRCFESGCELVSRHGADPVAFSGIE
jgi:hypothetical protein